MSKNTPPSENSPIHVCPSCKSPLRALVGKMGPFWGCSAFPDCKTTLNDVDGKPTTAINEEYRCPICTRRLVKSDRGYWFCSGYSKGCKITLEDESGVPKAAFRCRECGSLLTKRKGKNGFFWGCSEYPECSITYNDLDGRPDY
ncbi:MAG: ssDNA-binding Zn-finger/Zn-ribbon topoisomerase 1 [Pseudohongiellaceae bacterium]|jgi:ssDNA-binding Zn-finger/Zn-ribbon topoisomerase 1